MKISRFDFVLIIVLVLLFVFMAIRDTGRTSNVLAEENTMVVFYQPGCPHCEKERQYIDRVIKQKYPNLKVEYHNITVQSEMNTLRTYLEKYNITSAQLATPITFVNGSYMLGYEDDETSGKHLEQMIESKKIVTHPGIPDHIDTWFGRINVIKMSLPALAVTLGLLDGFNPCALWVLVYMISLIVGLNDKRKIWLIVGTFVLASAVLYYLFMTAFLSVFLYIGYLRILELAIGCFAIYVGIINLKNITKSECKVVEPGARQKTMGRVRHLVESRISLATILGIIVLAFVVNSMEFVCSAALPAVFTSVLAHAKLSLIQYHGYILLYVFFFMLNELIIFGTAAFAVNYYVGEKFIGPLRLTGGAVLLALGLIMVFFPGLLK